MYSKTALYVSVWFIEEIRGKSGMTKVFVDCIKEKFIIIFIKIWIMVYINIYNESLLFASCSLKRNNHILNQDSQLIKQNM